MIILRHRVYLSLAGNSHAILDIQVDAKLSNASSLTRPIHYRAKDCFWKVVRAYIKYEERPRANIQLECVSCRGSSFPRAQMQ